MKKRWLSCLCLLLSLCMLLSSCAASGMGESLLFRRIGASISGFLGRSVNLLSGNTPLFLDGHINFKPEITDQNAPLWDELLQAIELKTGVDLTDEGNTAASTIRVGLNLAPDLTAADTFIGFSENDLLITAASEPMLAQAVRDFIRLYVNGTDANAGVGYLYLPRELAWKNDKVSLLDEDGAPNYAIVYPEGSDTVSFGAVNAVRNAIKNITGASLSLKSDFLSDSGESYEILVGSTNRQASVLAAQDLDFSSYYIGISDHKIVLAASNNYMLQKAADTFIKLFFHKDTGSAALPAVFSYRHAENLVLLTNDLQSEYTLIYPSTASTEDIGHIRTFLVGVQQLTGVSIPAVSDAERPTAAFGGKELLVGNTNRHQSALAGVGLAAGQWSVGVMGNSIVAACNGENALRFSLQALLAELQVLAHEQNTIDKDEKDPIYPLLCLPTDLALRDQNAPDLVQMAAYPAPIGENGYLLYRNDATTAAYNEYITSLKVLGYREYTARTAGTVTAATYYNSTEILNITLTPADNILRVAVDPFSDSALPPLTATPYKGRTDIDPLFVQIGEIYASADCGMSYVIRLCDGTFIVIDGGWTDPSIANDLMAKLKELSPDRVPVIAAWIFTHGHTDHIGAFLRFTDTHYREVDLKSVVYSFPNEEQTLIHGGSNVNRYQNMIPSYVRRYMDDTVVYKARTGQLLQFPGCEIEMLFTFEDHILPKTLSYFNDSSLVFRMKLSKNGQDAQSFMILGDATTTVAAILVQRYGSYLKSDAVQVAHHGYDGGTDALYNTICAAVVFWPCPAKAPNGTLRFDNPEWSPVTRRMLGQDYAKVLYVACKGTVQLTLQQVKSRVIAGSGMVAADAAI